MSDLQGYFVENTEGVLFNKCRFVFILKNFMFKKNKNIQ